MWRIGYFDEYNFQHRRIPNFLKVRIRCNKLRIDLKMVMDTNILNNRPPSSQRLYLHVIVYVYIYAG